MTGKHRLTFLQQATGHANCIPQVPVDMSFLEVPLEGTNPNEEEPKSFPLSSSVSVICDCGKVGIEVYQGEHYGQQSGGPFYLRQWSYSGESKGGSLAEDWKRCCYPAMA